MDLLQQLMSLNLKCFFSWQLLFKWDMTYSTAWKTTVVSLTSCTILQQNMTLDRFLQSHWYLNFSSSDNDIDSNDPNYDLLWKPSCIFYLLTLKICFLPTADKAVVRFTGRLNFKPKNCKHFGMKIYILCCYMNECTHDNGCPLREEQVMCDYRHGCHLHERRGRDLGHKLYMDTWFSSSPEVFSSLTKM